MVLFPESCRIHLTAGLRLTWLSFTTAPQMDPTCLMPLNHDKVDFMGKPASCRPNMRGPRGHGWAKPTPTGETFESSGFNRGVAYHRFLYVRRANKAFECFSVFTSKHVSPSLFCSHTCFWPHKERKEALSICPSVRHSFVFFSEQLSWRIQRHMGPCGGALMTVWDAIPCYGASTTLTWSCTDGECTHVACTESRGT